MLFCQALCSPPRSLVLPPPPSTPTHLPIMALHAKSSVSQLKHCSQRWPACMPPRHRYGRPAAAQSAAAAPGVPPKKDPFAEKTVYSDGPVDKLFIKLFTQKMADQLEGVSVGDEPTYDDFVRVSKEIMRGRNTTQQHEVVAAVLQSLMPEQAPGVFRRMFPASQWSAEINAAIASAGFFWLVGESELRSEPVEVRPGLMREQRSVVHIKKCRYLESSSCVGMCVNMCKVPTQDYFTNQFGLPLTMKPDFETLSCDMIFGQAPPPLQQDEAYSQACLAPCSLAQGSGACPKIDTQRSAQEQQQQQQPGMAAGRVAAAPAAASQGGSV